MGRSFPGGFQPSGFQRSRGPRRCCCGCPVAACEEIPVSGRGLLFIHASHNTRSVSFKTENSCSSARGWRERTRQGTSQEPSWHRALLQAGWRGGGGAGRSREPDKGPHCFWAYRLVSDSPAASAVLRSQLARGYAFQCI